MELFEGSWGSMLLILEKSRDDFQKAHETLVMESDLEDTKSSLFYFFYQEMKSLFDDEDIETDKGQLLEIDQFIDD